MLSRKVLPSSMSISRYLPLHDENDKPMPSRVNWAGANHGFKIPSVTFDECIAYNTYHSLLFFSGMRFRTPKEASLTFAERSISAIESHCFSGMKCTPFNLMLFLVARTSGHDLAHSMHSLA
jgi:hypothetical protein